MYELRGYRSFWERLKVAWRIIRYGEPFPRPVEWYEPLHRLVTSPLGVSVRKAVEKSELEGGAHKYQEAQQWARHYLAEMKVYPHELRPGTVNFLIEWWVAKLGGKF